MTHWSFKKMLHSSCLLLSGSTTTYKAKGAWKFSHRPPMHLWIHFSPTKENHNSKMLFCVYIKTLITLFLPIIREKNKWSLLEHSLKIIMSHQWCSIFRTGSWATHKVLGGYLVHVGTTLVTPAIGSSLIAKVHFFSTGIHPAYLLTEQNALSMSKFQ